jgi:uncharacterized protein YggE
MGTETTLQLRLDWRVISGVLLTAIIVMLYLWQPWRPAATKTITVRGEATVSAVPDSFAFSPLYQDTDLAKVTATGNAVVAHLKQLGVKEADIKTSVSAADKTAVEPQSMPPVDRYVAKSTYSITATVPSQELAQKVADYLATTGATGQITPQASFSKATRTKLDLDARSAASDDAKRKAEVTAKQFGAKLGRVSKITEDGGYGIYPTMGRDSVASAGANGSSPVVSPGTNDMTYSFTVVFELN